MAADGFPKVMAAEVPGVGRMYYLVDENYDFIPEVKQFLDFKRSVGRAPNTLGAYCSRLTYFYRFLTQRGLCVLHSPGRKQVDSADMVAFLIWLCNPYRYAGNVDVVYRESPFQARTVNLILQAVGALYGYLVRHGRIKESPLKYVDVPRTRWLKERDLLAHTRSGKDANMVKRMELKLKEPIRRPKTVSDGDFNAFVDLIHVEARPNRDPSGFRDSLICIMLKEGGFRIGELLGMRLEDIEQGQGGVHVRFRSDNINGARAKAGRGRDRFVHLPARVMGLLDIYITQVWLEADPTHDYLWVVLKSDAKDRDGKDTYGQPLTDAAVGKMFEYYSKRSGIHIHPHKLRHTHATDLVRSYLKNRQPVDWKFIQERLGHDSVVTTMQVYAHLDDNDLKHGYDTYLERREQAHGSR